MEEVSALVVQQSRLDPVTYNGGFLCFTHVAHPIVTKGKDGRHVVVDARKTGIFVVM